MTTKWKHTLTLIALIVGTGVLGNTMYGHLVIERITDAQFSKVTTRFEVLFIVAVLIERSVETYLNINLLQRIVPVFRTN